MTEGADFLVRLRAGGRERRAQGGSEDIRVHGEYLKLYMCMRLVLGGFLEASLMLCRIVIGNTAQTETLTMSSLILTLQDWLRVLYPRTWG